MSVKATGSRETQEMRKMIGTLTKVLKESRAEAREEARREKSSKLSYGGIFPPQNNQRSTALA